MSATRTTAWIVELGIRVTLYDDLTFRTLRGFEPDFDPATVTFVTDRTVGNLAAHHGIRIMGDSISVARLTKAIDSSTKSIDRTLTLAELAEHKFLGGFDPEAVIAAYAETEAVAA